MHQWNSVINGQRFVYKVAKVTSLTLFRLCQLTTLMISKVPFFDINVLKRPKRHSNWAWRDHLPRNHLPPPSVHEIAHCKVYHVSL